MYDCLDKKRKKGAIFKNVKNVSPKLLIFSLFMFSLLIFSLFMFSSIGLSGLATFENSKGEIFFDIKIIDFESPIELGEFFEFSYLVKGMAGINDDIEIRFQIEKQGKIITSGSDTIYMGDFEEKIETTKIFLPKIMESGIYDFVVEVAYENYEAKSYRTIEIEVKEEIATIISEPKDPKIYVISALISLAVFILSLIFFLERKKIKKQFLQGEKWMKKYKVSILIFFLFVILGILAYYLDLFELIAKGVSKVVLWVKINIPSSYFYYGLGIILALVILVSLTIIVKKLLKRFKKWIDKTKNRRFLRKRRIDRLSKEKYKEEVKKSKKEFNIVSKISDGLGKKLKKWIKALINFLKTSIILFIRLIKKYSRKEKKEVRLMRQLYKRRRREELIERKKKLIKKEKGKVRRRIQNIFKKTGIPIKRTVQFLVKITKKTKNILNDIAKYSRKEKKEVRLMRKLSKKRRKEELIKRKKERKKQLIEKQKEEKRFRKRIQNIFKATGIQIKRTAQFLVKITKKTKSALKNIRKDSREKRKERLEKKKEVQRNKEIIEKRKQFFNKKKELREKEKEILEKRKKIE